MFRNYENYTFEQFIQNIQGATLNGGMTDALASGLYSQYDFENAPYYVCDCSRLPSDGVPKAVQLIGRIVAPNDSIKYDFLIFIENERVLKIDLRTGAVVQ